MTYIFLSCLVILTLALMHVGIRFSILQSRYDELNEWSVNELTEAEIKLTRFRRLYDEDMAELPKQVQEAVKELQATIIELTQPESTIPPRQFDSWGNKLWTPPKYKS